MTGGTDEIIENGEPTDYLKIVKQIVDYAIEQNKSGINYPIFGTCLGFHSMLVALTQYELPLHLSENDKITKLVNLTSSAYDSYLNLVFSNEEIDRLGTESVFLFRQHHGFFLDELVTYPYIQNNIMVIGTSITKGGINTLSIYQHKEYPFFATQFHAEKVQFEHEDSLNINLTEYSLDINAKLALVFRKMIGKSRVNMSNKMILSYRKNYSLVIGRETLDETLMFYNSGNDVGSIV